MSISKKHVLITGAVLVTLYIAFSIGYVINEKPTPAPTQEVQYRQDPQVKSYMDKLGLDSSKLNLELAPQEVLGKGVHGEFTPPNTLRLAQDQELKEIFITLSHEYLHYIQLYVDHEGAAQFIDYIPELEQVPFIHHKIAPYRTGEACGGVCTGIEEEIEAIACTEVSDSDLRPDFVAWCDQWLPNRAFLFL